MAIGLNPVERAGLAGWYSAATLDAARVRRVSQIENPDFYVQLGTIPLDFRTMTGITYGDTVLISDSQVPSETPLSLLFHELVHVVQYTVLGVDEFARRYVQGWADNAFDYFRIPLEVQAYGLQAEFESGAATTPIESPIRAELTR